MHLTAYATLHFTNLFTLKLSCVNPGIESENNKHLKSQEFNHNF